MLNVSLECKIYDGTTQVLDTVVHGLDSAPAILIRLNQVDEGHLGVQIDATGPRGESGADPVEELARILEFVAESLRDAEIDGLELL